MPDLIDLTPAELAAFTRKYALSGPPERVPSVGIVNRVYRAHWSGQVVALRVPLPGDHEDTLTESVAVPAAVRAGVRTPELLVFDNDRDVLDAPMTIYAWAQGRSLDAFGWVPGDPRLGLAWREAGRELARLHAGVRVVDDPNGWLDTAQGAVPERTLKRVTDTRRLGQQDAQWAVDTVRRLLHDAPLPASVFLHNDLHAGNLMVTDEGAVTALIDWGDAAWGDPVIDLCYAGPLAAPELLRGYLEAAPGALGNGGTLRLLAYLLDDATRRLAIPPEDYTADLWYTRPGTALMQLLRIAPLFPQWDAYLGSGPTAR
ncbi:aminoglycoside phosphotransferase family protein [Deinococcus sp.]|uniref:phosphotransferase family protein n=1 Tax=Deinococcus sp. TaxID=47478 RepID=UPI002869843A|nr:aminoglycoside phosphotransferase family protein [Deinococcus sp.]